MIAANPQYPVPMYNLACCEALSGRTADALEHLRQALERQERLRELAKEDSDLDPIRGEPAFKELVGPCASEPEPFSTDRALDWSGPFSLLPSS